MIGYYKHVTLALLLLLPQNRAIAGPISEPTWAQNLVSHQAAVLSAKENQLHLEFENKQKGADNPSGWTEKLQESSTAITQAEAKLNAFKVGFTKELTELKTDNGLQILNSNFSNARRLSSFHWQAIRDLFGAANEESFFKSSFAVAEIPSLATTDKQKIKFTVLVVLDPYSKIEASAQSSEWHSLQSFYRNSDLTAEIKTLKKTGYTVLIHDASAFTELDEQAAELKQQIENNAKQNKQPIVILSSGEASAIVHRYLDTNPGFRKSNSILAWINFNGRLHGLAMSLTKTDRKIASIEKGTCPTASLEADALLALTKMQSDRILASVPLGEGFPIFNVVRWNAADRASPELADELVSDGQSFSLSGSRHAEDIIAIFHNFGF